MKRMMSHISHLSRGPSTWLRTRRRGFTLMELLIVIALIGIMAAITVASYITAEKKSRDSRRISDLKATQNAWEQYYADHNNSYPYGPNPATPVACTLDIMTSSRTYLPRDFPVDPKSSLPYSQMYDGWSRCSATTYCFCAGMEVSVNGNASQDCTSGSMPVGYQGLYCIYNLQ